MEIGLQQIIDIVREAGTLMDRTGRFEVHDKGARENLVTTSDLAVQYFLTERLAALLPGSGFLCEEEDFADTAHADVWIIDPIDGTANYARGNENCCISVALVRGGELSIPAGASIQPGKLTLAGGTFSAPSYAATELIVEGESDDVSTLNAQLTLTGENQSVRLPGLYAAFKNGDLDTAFTATADD